jgi:hypothetical protein
VRARLSSLLRKQTHARSQRDEFLYLELLQSESDDTCDNFDASELGILVALVEPKCEQTISVGTITSSGSLRDGLEISAKCHVQRENLGQFHSKTGLAYRGIFDVVVGFLDRFGILVPDIAPIL